MIGNIKILLERIDVHSIDLESDFVELPLRHHKYELNKTTPFTWFITSSDKTETIKIKLVVDKQALAEDKDIDTLVLETLKYNEAFKDFVDSLKSFEPQNDKIKSLYQMDTWHKIDKTNVLVYTKTIKFGV
jgi:hypothetical protein